MMEYLTLGIVKGGFSLNGTLKIYSTSDYANERYRPKEQLFLVNPKNEEAIFISVISYARSGLFDLVRCEEITTPEEANAYKGWEVRINKAEHPLKEGYFYYGDLIGCAVFDEEGNELGTVTCVEEFPAQKTLRVKRINGRDFFVPMLNVFIKKIDINTKKITVKVMEGML